MSEKLNNTALQKTTVMLERAGTADSLLHIEKH